MKKTSLLLATVVALTTLTIVGSVFAEDNTPEPTEKPEPTAVMHQEATEAPHEGQEIRNQVREIQQENKQERQEVRSTIRENRQEMITGIKEENKALRQQWQQEKAGKTPKEVKELRPTYIEQTKELIQKHVAERQTFWQSAKTQFQTLGDDIKARWTSLWSSWFGNK